MDVEGQERWTWKVRRGGSGRSGEGGVGEVRRGGSG